jgi:hypothetical protein
MNGTLDQNADLRLQNATQLIDLNRQKTSFKLKYQVISEVPNVAFYCSVQSQADLDQSDKVPLQPYTGRCEGVVSNNSGMFQNYFLALKSDRPIRVRLIVNELPPDPPIPSAIPQPVVVAPEDNYTRNLLMGAAVVVGLYFIFSRKKGGSRW